MEGGHRVENHYNNNHAGSAQSDEISPKKTSLTAQDKPQLLIHEEGKIVRKALKGHIDSSDIKKSLNLHDEP